MDNSALEDLSKRILDSIIDSYQTASQVNDKPLLRNFLWNNGNFILIHRVLQGTRLSAWVNETIAEIIRVDRKVFRCEINGWKTM